MANTPNVYEQQFEYDDTDPAGYRAGVTRIGATAGGKDLVIKEFEIPPGETVCPYHYEYKEEWLLLVSGTLELRDPDGRHPLRAGDLVRFPLGPDGAHQVTNNGHHTDTHNAGRTSTVTGGTRPLTTMARAPRW